MKLSVSSFNETRLRQLYSFARSCVKAFRLPRGSNGVSSETSSAPIQRGAVALVRSGSSLAGASGETQHEFPMRGTGRPVAQLAVSTLLNAGERWIPTQFATSSTWTSLCQVAQMARDTGGFDARSFSTAMTTARIWLPGCADTHRVLHRIEAVAGGLLQIGMDALAEDSIPVGCLPALALRDRGDANLEVALRVEGVGARERSVIATAAHAIVVPLARLAECRGEPEIQVGVLEAERVRARCRIKLSHLRRGPAELPSTRGGRGERRDATAIGQLMRSFGIDSHHPELAAKHNAQVIEGLTAAAAAMGIDSTCWAIEAEGHAARWGSCEPLARWREWGDELVGELCLPVDLQRALDTLRRTEQSSESATLQAARDVVVQVATIGLTASLVYLRAVLLAGTVDQAGRASPPLPAARPRESRSNRRWLSSRAVSASGVHEALRPGGHVERALVG